ncbi:MAG: Cell division ATP-binding protein FtsE [Candidatus Levybacteria bacterium GW2011_GWB1_36_18]|nr:MAG: Cell division ATP-binding protein FtsE [Candidatus Levybacteria bacterium GW2011_GWB1_36_18]
MDPATSWEIVKVLSDINEQGTTVVMATHNADIIKSLSKRVLELSQGNLVKDSKTKHKAKDKEENKEEKEEEKQ